MPPCWCPRLFPWGFRIASTKVDAKPKYALIPYAFELHLLVDEWPGGLPALHSCCSQIVMSPIPPAHLPQSRPNAGANVATCRDAGYFS